MFDIKKCYYCKNDAVYMCNCNSDTLCEAHFDSHRQDIQKVHVFNPIYIFMSEKTKSYLNSEIIERINLLKRVQDYLTLKTSEAIQNIRVASTKLFKQLEDLKNYYYKIASTSDFAQSDRMTIESIIKSNLIFSEINLELPQFYLANFSQNIIISENYKDVQTIAEIESYQKKPPFDILCTTIGQSTNPIKCVAISRNFEFAVLGFSDKTITIFNIRQNTVSGNLMGHSLGILCIGITNSMEIIVSGSEDKLIKLWDVKKKQEIAYLDGHREKVNCLAIFSDDSMIATGSTDFEVYLWSIQDKKPVKRLKGHNSSVLSVSVTNNCQSIISSSANKKICIWEVTTGNLIKTLQCHTLAVCSLATSKDSLLFASASLDNTIKIWNGENYQEIKSIEYSSLTPSAIQFLSLKTSLVAGYENGKAIIYDPKTGDIQGYLNGNNSKINSIVVSADRKIVVAAVDHGLKLWDISCSINS